MGKKTHLCAKMVKKEGKTYETIPEQHTMLEDGTVTHYDITDGKTILENVPVEDLEIVIAEAHEHFDNHDKNAEVLGEGGLYANIHAKRKRGEKMRKKVKRVPPLSRTSKMQQRLLRKSLLAKVFVTRILRRVLLSVRHALRRSVA